MARKPDIDFLCEQALVEDCNRSMVGVGSGLGEEPRDLDGLGATSELIPPLSQVPDLTAITQDPLKTLLVYDPYGRLKPPIPTYAPQPTISIGPRPPVPGGGSVPVTSGITPAQKAALDSAVAAQAQALADGRARVAAARLKALQDLAARKAQYITSEPSSGGIDQSGPTWAEKQALFKATLEAAAAAKEARLAAAKAAAAALAAKQASAYGQRPTPTQQPTSGSAALSIITPPAPIKITPPPAPVSKIESGVSALTAFAQAAQPYLESKTPPPVQPIEETKPYHLKIFPLLEPTIPPKAVGTAKYDPTETSEEREYRLSAKATYVPTETQEEVALRKAAEEQFVSPVVPEPTAYRNVPGTEPMTWVREKPKYGFLEWLGLAQRKVAEEISELPEAFEESGKEALIKSSRWFYSVFPETQKISTEENVKSLDESTPDRKEESPSAMSSFMSLVSAPELSQDYGSPVEEEPEYIPGTTKEETLSVDPKVKKELKNYAETLLGILKKQKLINNDGTANINTIDESYTIPLLLTLRSYKDQIQKIENSLSPESKNALDDIKRQEPLKSILDESKKLGNIIEKEGTSTKKSTILNLIKKISEGLMTGLKISQGESFSYEFEISQGM